MLINSLVNFYNFIIEEIPVGEASKSFLQLEKTCDNLVGKIDRRTAIVLLSVVEL